jgi:predicted site-specific integrase-resolvase
VKLISLEAASIAAGVSRKTITRWMAAGLLTRYERPGQVRVLVDAAELRELVTPKPVGKVPRRR